MCLTTINGQDFSLPVAGNSLFIRRGFFMHDDYKNRLTELSDKLTEVVINEANPDNWPGAEKPVKQLSKDERGDRYWSKKTRRVR